MKEAFVLDACALLAFLNDEIGANIVENLLVRADSKEIRLNMSAINVLEIYYGIFREDGPDAADAVLGKIEILPIHIVRIFSEETLREAGRLKASYRISLADAVALSEANIRNAALVTADHHELDLLETKREFEPLWIR
jgi:uncharacterized protein